MQGRISKSDQYKGSDRNPHHTYQHGYNRAGSAAAICPAAASTPSQVHGRCSLPSSSLPDRFHGHQAALLLATTVHVSGSAALVFLDPTPRVALQPFKPLRGVTRFKLDAFSLREHRTAGLPISRLRHVLGKLSRRSGHRKV